MNIDLQLLLKRLIAAEIILIFLLVVFDLSLESSLPQILQDYRNSMLEKTLTTTDWAILFIELSGSLFYIVGLFGLWKLKRNSRIYFTLGLFISLIAQARYNPYILPPLAQVCSYLSAINSGLIIGLIFFSDLREFFNKYPKNLAVETPVT